MLPALTVPIKEWSLGLESEAAYWRLMTASGWVFRARNYNSTTKVKTSFKKKVYDYSADLNARLDHMKPFLFEPELLSTADTGQKIFRVLDVGSGPISWMGWRLSRPDLFFESIPVDPLGHLYRRILDEQHPPGLQPTANGGPSRAVPARPLALRAEALTSLFAHNSFDMVASRNAIDHSQDPLRCLSEMVATVKPGRFVVLELFEREGAIQNYRDLHKWNFMWTQARGLELGGKGTRLESVQQILRKEVASINCSRGYRERVDLGATSAMHKGSIHKDKETSTDREISCFLKKHVK